jgi:tetratricopeptide (TPR) repeat protein/glycosyltransferase involved in cell wall biosynthesis
MNDIQIPAGCLGVVMPVFNEENTLRRIVARVLARPEVGELVLVNDCSSDRTWELMQALAATDPRIRIFRHATNQGKGAALRTGFAQATADFVIIQDADLEYDPDEYPKLLLPVLAGEADVVLGSRFVRAGQRSGSGFCHSSANKFLTWLSNRCTGLHLTDMETCYKLFRREVLSQITIEEDSFAVEPELVAKIAGLKVSVREVAIAYAGRTSAEGKKIGWWDGLQAIRCILRHRIIPNTLWIFAAALLAVVMVAYLPAWHGGFVWDDDAHVTSPALRSWHGLYRIWFEVGATQQYYPLVHSAFWLEHRLWGDSPTGYHLVNLVLHSWAALLVALILRRLAVPGALLAAVVFALHPVHVESVAWITELKNTLSAVLYLSAMLCYLRFDADRMRRWYVAALGLFILALLSKTVTASLPAALLVIFWWRRGRLGWRSDALPLLPFFVLGAAGGLFTAWVERTFIGAEGAEFQFSLVERCLMAGRVVWFYLGKLLWPADLIFIYPRWEISQQAWWQYLFPLAALGLLVGLWLLRKRTRAPLAAVLFFAGTLFPVMGFFNVYPFRYSFVADHFQYLASLGIISLGCAGVCVALVRWRCAGGRVQVVLGCVIAGLLGFLTWQQCGQYADSATLYQETIRRNPGCWLAHNNLGNDLNGLGRPAEAIPHFEEVVRLKPDYPNGHNNWGNSLQSLGRIEESIERYQEALRLKPDYPEAHNNLGGSLQALGRPQDAIPHYAEALRIKPSYAEAHNNWANALTNAGRPKEALAHCAAAVRLKPDYAEAYNNWGNALNALGQPAEAAVQCQEALRLQPDYLEAHLNLGNALNALGRTQEAVTHYEEALRLKPNLPEAHNNLANALNTLQRYTEAVAHCEEALRLSPNYVAAHLNCVNALKALGRTEEALRHFNKARSLMPNR